MRKSFISLILMFACFLAVSGNGSAAEDGALFPSVMEIQQGRAAYQALNEAENAAQKKAAEKALPGPLSDLLSEDTTSTKNKDQDLVKAQAVKKELDRLEVDISTHSGLRWDSLKWNIAGDINGQNPNILSELTWDDLWIYELGTKGKVVLDQTFRLEGSFDYGWILNGQNQDSDYSGDDKTLEFSRSNNATDGDTVLDTSLGLGLQFHVGAVKDWESFLTDDLWIAFLGGYSYHEQNLRMTDGFQTWPATGEFAGLNSTYQTEWKGPWAGIELFGFREKFSGFSRFEYHWADYHAEADWNLRDDFAHPVSYTHDADGTGIVVSFGGEYQITDRWTAGLKGDVSFWETGPGLDRTFFADGTSSDTRLNEVIWRSYSLALSATYKF